MKLVVTIDVEEEGLFRNRYEARPASVANVTELLRLDALFREWSIAPTLLVTDPVARHAPHRELLLRLKDQWGAEIGGHLHPWNTPPFQPLPYPEPVPSERMPRELLQAKLRTLLESIGALGLTPTAFRMGRFNLGPQMFSLLADAGVRVDSSIAPMRRYAGGPDHLAAPVDPYFPDPADPRTPGLSLNLTGLNCHSGTLNLVGRRCSAASCFNAAIPAAEHRRPTRFRDSKRETSLGGILSPILEVPVTIVPVLPRLGAWLERSPLPSAWASWFAMRLGSWSAQPVWAGLRQLKTAALLHRRRGGQVLTIHFHSSELMPGGSPHHPTTAHVDRFFDRLRKYFDWLHRELAVESVTLSELDEDIKTDEPNNRQLNEPQNTQRGKAATDGARASRPL